MHLPDPGPRSLAPPAMKAAVLFALGICAGRVAAVVVIPALLGAIAVAVAVLIRRRPGAADLFVAVALVFAGMTAGAAGRAVSRPFIPPEPMRGRTVTVTGTVVDSPRFRFGAYRFTLRSRSVAFEGNTVPAAGMLPCVVYHDAAPLEGTTLRLTGTPGITMRPVGRRGLLPADVPPPFRLLVRRDDPAPVVLGDGALFARVRAYAVSLLGRHNFGGHRDFLAAMTVGDITGLTPDMQRLFTNAGIAHILAVSGLNVGIVLLAAGLLIGFLPAGRMVRAVLLVLTATGYAALCGFGAPIARAALMSAAVLGAPLLFRRADLENILFASVLVILAVDPLALFSPSLQLSAAAVWGLVLIVPPLTAALPRRIRRHAVPRYVAGLAITSVAAYMVTTPIAAAHFGTVSPAGILVNLPAVPLAAVALWSGLLAMVLTPLGVVAGLPAAGAAAIAGASLDLVVRIADLAGKIPAPTAGSGRAAFLAVVLLAWMYLWSRSRGRPRFAKGLVFLPLAALAAAAWAPLDPGASIVVFDVGQGDAVLVRDFTGRAFLVDAGPAEGFDTGKVVVAPSLAALGVRRLDALFISHAHEDHTGGIPAVLKAVRVDRIFARTELADSLSQAFGRPVTGLAAGDSIDFGSAGVAVLYPPGEPYGNENDRSLLLRFSTGGERLLFAGDLETAATKRAAAWGNALSCDVLKVPHHGGDDLSDQFLLAADPAAAFISCGRNNRYGHPAPETLDRLARAGATVYRTDQNGTVELRFPLRDRGSPVPDVVY